MRALRYLMMVSTGLLIAVLSLVVLFAILSGAGLIRDRAEFELPDRQVSLAIERRTAHPVMPEFHRTLIVSQEEREIIRQKMFMDTANNVRVNVYQMTDGTVWLLDAVGVYKIDLSQLQVVAETVCFNFVPDGEFIGAFDETYEIWRRRLRFFPAAERGPLPIDYFFPEIRCDDRIHS